MSEREFVDGAFYWVTRDEISTVVRFDGEVGGFDCFRGFSDETLHPEQLRSEGYEIGPCLGKEPPICCEDTPEWQAYRARFQAEQAAGVRRESVAARALGARPPAPRS